MDCDAIVSKFRSLDKTEHKFNPPCSHARIDEVEGSLGPMPKWLHEMLSCFNGAELFIYFGTSFTIFGNAAPGQPDYWSIDVYTSLWRQHGARDGEWPIGITDYGGLYIAGPDDSVREWDTSAARWIGSWDSPERWVDHIIKQALISFAELKADEDEERR